MQTLLIISKRPGQPEDTIYRTKSKASSKQALRRHTDRLDSRHGGILHHSFMVDGTETLIYNIPFAGNS